jgi:CheY-like chemotaxis protein
MEFDVMFIGIMLPEVDGYDVCRHVRKYGGPVNGKAYIAALTSVDAPELLSQCQAAGMNEVMRKPTSMQLLHGVFKRAKRHAREEKKKAKMSRGRLKLGGLSADEVAAQERPRPRRINSYAPSDPFAKKEKTDAEKEKEEREKCVPGELAEVHRHVTGVFRGAYPAVSALTREHVIGFKRRRLQTRIVDREARGFPMRRRIRDE